MRAIFPLLIFFFISVFASIIETEHFSDILSMHLTIHLS